MQQAAVLASVFPYDSAIDSIMGHRHLVIAYALTWVVHLLYLLYAGRTLRSAGESREE